MGRLFFIGELLQRNSKVGFLLGSKVCYRRASYFVNKVRTMDWLKNDDEALMAEVKRAQFLVFYNKRPLLRRKTDKFGFESCLIPHNSKTPWLLIRSAGSQFATFNGRYKPIRKFYVRLPYPTTLLGKGGRVSIHAHACMGCREQKKCFRKLF